jgi:hypothetical protein
MHSSNDQFTAYPAPDYKIRSFLNTHISLTEEVAQKQPDDHQIWHDRMKIMFASLLLSLFKCTLAHLNKRPPTNQGERGYLEVAANFYGTFRSSETREDFYGKVVEMGQCSYFSLANAQRHSGSLSNPTI